MITHDYKMESLTTPHVYHNNFEPCHHPFFQDVKSVSAASLDGVARGLIEKWNTMYPNRYRFTLLRDGSEIQKSRS